MLGIAVIEANLYRFHHLTPTTTAGEHLTEIISYMLVCRAITSNSLRLKHVLSKWHLAHLTRSMLD
jgi:hypothetical protein